MQLLGLVVVAAFVSNVAAQVGISSSQYNDFIRYWKYAGTAYEDNCASPLGQTLVGTAVDTKNDIHGYVVKDSARREIVVGFRGTASDANIGVDFNFPLTNFVSPGVTAPSGTQVHTGFLAAYNAIQPTIQQLVQQTSSQNPGYAIVTVGHSLGGALASIAGVALRANVPNKTYKIYTYGQPRTGNAAYAKWVNGLYGQNVYRIVHYNDGVPTFVPTFLGYQHHGNEYWDTTDTSSAALMKKCSGNEDPTCSDSIFTAFINQGHLEYMNYFFNTAWCSNEFTPSFLP